MKQKIFLLFILCSLSLQLPAQTNSKIRQLRSQKAQLQKKIQKSEQQLKSTSRSVQKGLNSLSVLNGQIEKQEKSIKDMQFRIDSIQHHVNRLAGELRKLNKQLEEKKDKYRRSMLYLYNNRKTQNKLLFILSADNFSQMMRRYRYTREYAKYQRVQGMLIQKKEKQVHDVQAELLRNKSKHSQALGKQQIEKDKLVNQQDQQKKAVKQLQSQQKQIQNVLARNKKEMAQLNGKIEYYVQQAIEQERKRREAEERKRREEEARKARRSNDKKDTASKKGKTKNEGSQKSTRKNEPMPEYRESSKEYKLGQSFSSNRGKLPVPITGPYVISAHYGNYSMKGLTGVRLDNKGINLTTQGPSNARCVFDGEVSMVFSFGGMMNVLVRHGSYISVYCNLSSVSVSKGQHVSTRQMLGRVSRDASGSYTLHFQLRKETTILNPERWIAK